MEALSKRTSTDIMQRKTISNYQTARRNWAIYNVVYIYKVCLLAVRNVVTTRMYIARVYIYVSNDYWETAWCCYRLPDWRRACKQMATDCWQKYTPSVTRTTVTHADRIWRHRRSRDDRCAQSSVFWRCRRRRRCVCVCRSTISNGRRHIACTAQPPSDAYTVTKL